MWAVLNPTSYRGLNFLNHSVSVAAGSCFYSNAAVPLSTHGRLLITNSLGENYFIDLHQAGYWEPEYKEAESKFNWVWSLYKETFCALRHPMTSVPGIRRCYTAGEVKPPSCRAQHSSMCPTGPYTSTAGSSATILWGAAKGNQGCWVEWRKKSGMRVGKEWIDGRRRGW